MDSDDEEMRDAASSLGGAAGEEDGEFRGEEEDDAAGDMDDAAEEAGVMVLEVAWVPVDLDYEFDAPRWFDLAREEAPLQAAAAQQWFASAPSYPPSPLISKLLAEDLGLQTFRSIADTDSINCSTTSHECPTGTAQRIHHSEGRKLCNGAPENERKPGSRTTMRGISSRGSTLMRPTASQLARQNRQVEANILKQSKKSVGGRSERNTMSSNDCTYQSAKRQRLENGHLNKAAPATQHLEFIHKNHEKNVLNRKTDLPTGLPKLKITIPREPELATKLRAERSRVLRSVPTDSKQLNQWVQPYTCTAQVASTRKVVQPFRATDHQRASRQHKDAGSNVAACISNRARHHNNAEKKQEDCRDDLFKFKARPLDRKILTSKGDAGVFRSSKKIVTVPKEFNLSTSKKGNPAPLSELFNKLSLTAGLHRGIDRPTSNLPNYITTKDCKENMIGNLQC